MVQKWTDLGSAMFKQKMDRNYEDWVKKVKGKSSQGRKGENGQRRKSESVKKILYLVLNAQ